MITCLTKTVCNSLKRSRSSAVLVAASAITLMISATPSSAGAQAFSGNYTFGSSGNVASFDYNGAPITNLTVSPIVKAAGITTSSSSGNFRATNWSTGALASDDYIEFSLTAGTGFVIDMTSITFGVGRSGTGTRSWEWKSDVDSYAGAISTYTTVNDGLTNTSGVLTNPDANSSWTGNILDLSGAAFDGLSSVTFRLYSYNSKANTGTAGLQGPLFFSGTLVADTPTPSSGNFWVGDNTVLGGNGTWTASGGTSWRSDNTDGGGGAFTANQTANFGGATAGTVTVSGTVAPEAGLNFTTTGYTVTGGTINLAGANATANTITTNTSVTATIESNLTGSNGMTKAGAGNLVLTGTNSYTGGTTVSTGTLTGNSDSLQGAIVNNAAVVFDQGATGEYAGAMSGSGSLTKTGADDLTLSGTNSYSGGTTVSAGSLIGTTTSLQANISNNATVVFNQGTTGTYAGNMTGTGSLVKDGDGDVTLGGTNSYSGGTTVTAGTLTGTTTSLQGAITNNAAVVFNQGTAGTYAGNMSGNGSLTKSGAGNLSLSGTNSYSRGTTVSAGTLTGTTSSLQRNIANNAAVVFDQSTTGTYSGAMSGTGTLAKTGDGAVTLTGNSSYQGGTSITGGTLVAGSNTALGTGGVTMSSGQVLGGDGVTVANAISIGTAASTTTGVIAGWDFNGLSSYGASPLTANTTVSEVAVGGLTRGAGVATSGTAASNAWGGSEWSTSSSAAAAISTNDFATFTLNGNSGASLSLASIGAYNIRRSSSGPITGLWQYQIGSGSFVDLGSAITWGSNTSATGNSQGSIDLSGITALQNVASGTTVTFRVVNYSASGTGTWYFNHFQSGDDFTVSGSVPVAASGNGTLGINTTGTTTYTGPITVNNTATLTAATGGTAVFEGAIGGSGSITKTGEGTVVLAAANTYSGGTTISAGTLSVTGAGSLGNGTVSVASGATFDLSAKAITLELGSGFTLDGSLVMTANMSSFTNITGSGTFTFGDDSTLFLDVAGITSPGSYALISGYSSYTNLGTLGTNFTVTGGSFGSSAYSILQSGGTLSLVVVPEPHEYALMIAGLLGLIIVIRRLRSKASVTA
jgi:autotransporter-associated beta strand protein